MSMHEVIENATSFDELLAGPEIAPLTKNILLQKGTAYKRGMLITDPANITPDEGEDPATSAAQTAAGGVADYVLAADIDLMEASADTAGTVYVSGRFNREKIVLAESDTVEAHEAELRLRNILFTALK